MSKKNVLLFLGVTGILSWPWCAFPESHTPGNGAPSGEGQREKEAPQSPENPKLFQKELGDLNELERKEVQTLSDQIRQAAKKPAKKGENLSEFFQWEQKAYEVEKVQKKLLEKLQKKLPKEDAQKAKQELEALYQICIERKSAAWARWIRPW